MNTTPTTSNRPASYTVVGGPGGRDTGDANFSLILLNRGSSMSRAEALSDFERLRPGEIISIENPGNTLA
ncbi:MAG: hypothetical protein FWG35_08680, partial [Spirochaetaceae bacterium]|nr:hypothetical protein [Spirochaetaceae bacterium]